LNVEFNDKESSEAAEKGKINTIKEKNSKKAKKAQASTNIVSLDKFRRK
jgi:hypothetical protein